MVQQRVLKTAAGSFFLRTTPAAREFLLMEGADWKYGARHLERAIEWYVVYPLALLVATDQVNVGDVLLIDRYSRDKGLAFLKETEQPSVPVEILLAASNADYVLNVDTRG